MEKEAKDAPVHYRAEEAGAWAAGYNRAVEEIAGTPVHVLSIEHKHGTNISVHRTREGVDLALEEYARNWWHRWVRNDERAPDGFAVVAAYFELTGDRESYHIQKALLED